MRRLFVLLLLLSFVLPWGAQAQTERNPASPFWRDLTAWYPILPAIAPGVRWWDLSPSLAHASVIGAPLVKGEPTGRFAGMLSLTGTQYADAGNVGAWTFASSDPLSISCWFATTSSSTTNADLVGKYANTSPYTGYSLASSSLGITWYLADENGGTGGDAGIVTTAGYHDGRLHHVVAVHDGSRTESGMALYVDGKRATVTSAGFGSSFSGTLLNSQPGRIGANGLANTNWVGTIGNVMLYNRALTANDVQGLYQMQAPDYRGLLVGDDPLALVQTTPVIRRKVVIQ